MNDQQAEQLIQNAGADVAPRVTPQDIEANITHCYYFNAWSAAFDTEVHMPDPALKLLTFCVLVLNNGFTVTGESACVSLENFDAEIGRQIARENAVNKIWPLMGYELKQRLHEGRA